MSSKWLLAALTMVVSVGSMAWLPAMAQDPVPDDGPAEESRKDQGDLSSRSARPPRRIRPYDRVITKEAKTSAGLFLVHRLEDKVFFEIPTAELGKEMLWVTQIEQTQAGYSYGGEPVGDRVVRWEQRGDDILLRDVKFEIRADINDPIKDAVQASSLEAIIAVLPVQAYGKDKAAGDRRDRRSSTSDLPEFSVGRRLRASGIDPRRDVHREGQVVPDEHRGQGHDDLPPARRRGLAGPGGPIPTPGGDSDAGGRHRDAAPQHDRAARGADEAPAVTTTASASSRCRSRTTASQEAGGRERPVHHAMAAGEEGPQGRRSPSRGSRSSSTSAARSRRSSARGSRRGSRPGSRRSRRPASRTRSSPRTPPRPARTPTGTPRTPGTRRSAGSPPPSRTPTGRTSTTRGPARSSRPTSGCITTS